MVHLFDSHAHLLFERMGQPDEVLERARQAGVSHVMTVALGPGTEELEASLQRLHDSAERRRELRMKLQNQQE